jgi:hypothetical protein
MSESWRVLWVGAMMSKLESSIGFDKEMAAVICLAEEAGCDAVAAWLKQVVRTWDELADMLEG